MANCFYPTNIFSRNLTNHPFISISKEMNKLFEDESLHESSKSFLPRTDIMEDEKNYFLTTELPGVEENDIDISLKNGRLTLKAEKKSTIEKNEKSKHYLERVFGNFERTIDLGDKIDEDNIIATFKNGVLNLTIPKIGPIKPIERKININPAAKN
jgi:HSP20 family protein